MDPRRVCEIYALPRCGSGFLIADDLILTAAHVVGAVGARVQVRLIADGIGQRDAEVVWAGGSRRMDAALLRLFEAANGPSAMPFVRWGRLVGSVPGVSCEATGFPEAMASREPDGTVVRRDMDQVSGTINPLSRWKERLLEASVTSASPAPTPSDTVSPWGGMSGAALWCSKLLTGVVVKDPVGFASRRLTAIPVTDLLADADFARLVGAAAGAAPVPEPVELIDFQVQRSPLVTPASLLRSDAETVRFSGRGQILDDLETAWCAGPGRVSARLLTGPAGSGKSRLARQFGERMASAGWATVHLAEEPVDLVPDAKRYEPFADLRSPLLLIVDYAETRRRQIMRVAQYLTGDRQEPVRVLLLARAAGEWWDELAAASAGLAWLSPRLVGQISLKPLVGADGRAAAFGEAVTGLAAALPHLTEGQHLDWEALAARIEPPDLSTGRYASILSVQIAALGALLSLAQGEDDLVDTTPDAILLDHETRYWNKLAEARGVQFPDADRTRRGAVTAASVCGASGLEEAHSTIARVPGFGDQSEALRRAAAIWLHDLYPMQGRYWGSLEPDRLAEYLTSRALADVPSLLEHALAAASYDQAYRAITLLSRAARVHSHLAGIMVEAIVAFPDTLGPAAVVVAVEAEEPGPLNDALDRVLAGDVSPELLARLAAAIAPLTRLHADRAVNIAYRLMGAARAADDKARGRGIFARLRRRTVPTTAALAASLGDLSSRLAQVGRYDQAVGVAKEQVRLSRWLVRTDPNEFTPELAEALCSLGRGHARSGRSVQALEATKEAVEYYRRLSRISPEMHRPVLAGALTDLRDRFFETKKEPEAFKTTAEVVRLYRQLALADPDTFTPDLAAALSVQGTKLHEAGRHTKAAEAEGEAAKLYQRLADAQPDTFTPYLADAFLILGAALGAAGRLGPAQEASEQAVEVSRHLVDVNADAFMPVHARAMANLGVVLASAGDWGKAEVTTRAAIDLYRPLASGQPFFVTELAKTLIRYGDVLISLGDQNQAHTITQEAIGLLANEHGVARSALLLHAFAEVPTAMADLHTGELRGFWEEMHTGGPAQFDQRGQNRARLYEHLRSSGELAGLFDSLRQGQYGEWDQGHYGAWDQGGRWGQGLYGTWKEGQLGQLGQGDLGALGQSSLGELGQSQWNGKLGQDGDDDPLAGPGPDSTRPKL